MFYMFNRLEDKNIQQSVVTVYCVLRKQNVDVYFSRLQCIWKLTDEWANFILAYETDCIQLHMYSRAE